MNGMTELDINKTYEWFVINAGTARIKKSEYFTMDAGCGEAPVDATVRIKLTDDIRNNIVFQMMIATGFKDTGKPIDPTKHFKRGFRFHAKPVKLYHGGDVNDVRWTLALDTITARKQDTDIPTETLERIQLIVSKSPNFNEAVRRMSSSDPNLVFTFGYAVGSGLMDREGKI